MKKLGRLIPLCWSKETSADQAHWSTDNPALGQCAVTALIVYLFMGGEIMRTIAQHPSGYTRSHYFNRLPDGRDYDLTARQFPDGTTYVQPGRRTTQYMLGDFPDTAHRFARLMLSLAKLLQAEATNGGGCA